MKETPMQEEFDMEKELQQEFIQELAEFFKIFGDATRIRILQTLLGGGAKCGGFGRRTGNEPICCVASAARTAAE